MKKKLLALAAWALFLTVPALPQEPNVVTIEELTKWGIEACAKIETLESTDIMAMMEVAKHYNKLGRTPETYNTVKVKNIDVFFAVSDGFGENRTNRQFKLNVQFHGAAKISLSCESGPVVAYNRY